MALSDAVLGNHAMIYVGVIIVNCTAWSLERASALDSSSSSRLRPSGAADAVSRYNRVSVEDLSHRHSQDGGGICKGGICWHGVAVRSPASQNLANDDLFCEKKKVEVNWLQIIIIIDLDTCLSSLVDKTHDRG
ncbi:unnamed protein product [Brassica rapa subsp. trilocularis]